MASVLRSSPLVRRMARENNVDLNQVPGTGLGGRISKSDIQSFIQQHGQGGGRPQMVSAPPQHRARRSNSRHSSRSNRRRRNKLRRSLLPYHKFKLCPVKLFP